MSTGVGPSDRITELDDNEQPLPQQPNVGKKDGSGSQREVQGAMMAPSEMREMMRDLFDRQRQEEAAEAKKKKEEDEERKAREAAQEEVQQFINKEEKRANEDFDVMIERVRAQDKQDDEEAQGGLDVISLSEAVRKTADEIRSKEKQDVTTASEEVKQRAKAQIERSTPAARPQTETAAATAMGKEARQKATKAAAVESGVVSGDDDDDEEPKAAEVAAAAQKAGRKRPAGTAEGQQEAKRKAEAPATEPAGGSVNLTALLRAQGLSVNVWDAAKIEINPLLSRVVRGRDLEGELSVAAATLEPSEKLAFLFFCMIWSQKHELTPTQSNLFSIMTAEMVRDEKPLGELLAGAGQCVAYSLNYTSPSGANPTVSEIIARAAKCDLRAVSQDKLCLTLQAMIRLQGPKFVAEVKRYDYGTDVANAKAKNERGPIQMADAYATLRNEVLAKGLNLGMADPYFDRMMTRIVGRTQAEEEVLCKPAIKKDTLMQRVKAYFKRCQAVGFKLGCKSAPAHAVNNAPDAGELAMMIYGTALFGAVPAGARAIIDKMRRAAGDGVSLDSRTRAFVDEVQAKRRVIEGVPQIQ